MMPAALCEMENDISEVSMRWISVWQIVGNESRNEASAVFDHKEALKMQMNWVLTVLDIYIVV